MSMKSENNNQPGDLSTFKQKWSLKRVLLLCIISLISLSSMIAGVDTILKGGYIIYKLHHLNQGFLITDANIIGKEIRVPYKGPNYHILHYEYSVQIEDQSLQIFTGNSIVDKAKYNSTQISDTVTIIYAKSDFSVSQIKQGLEVKGDYETGWVNIGIGMIWIVLTCVGTYVVFFWSGKQKEEIVTTHTIGNQEIRVIQVGRDRYVEIWNTETGELVSRKRA